MASEVLVRDDFLPNDVFMTIYDMMMSTWFEWYYNQSVTHGNEEDLYCRGQFVHTFYSRDQRSDKEKNILNVDGVMSQRMKTLIPLSDHIGIKKPLKIKANQQLRTDKIERNPYHVDFTDLVCTTSVYYINTCDGYTQFMHGEHVQSKSNRLVTFPSYLKHAGTTCTDQKRRVVLNLNYYA